MCRSSPVSPITDGISSASRGRPASEVWSLTWRATAASSGWVHAGWSLKRSPASFARECRSCPLRRRCTTARQGRVLHLHPHEDELRAARRRAMTRSFQQSYRRWRPMVERSIAWLVADGCRRVPYRGIARNDLWWSVRVAAVNLRRLLALGLARQDAAWVLA
jgi:Transposase DDE domain